MNRQRSAAGSFEDPDQLPADLAHLQDAGAVISPHSEFTRDQIDQLISFPFHPLSFMKVIFPSSTPESETPSEMQFLLLLS